MDEANRIETNSQGQKNWLVFALITVGLWGIWGALTGLSAQNNFPETLTYCVWAVTMIFPSLYVMQRAKWKLDRSPKAILFGMLIGILGAGGQMVLFYALTVGPAYFIFPIISVSPLVTIAMSFFLLGERTNMFGVIGVFLSLIALPLFDLSFTNPFSGNGVSWFALAILIMLCWGAQGYFMKHANQIMSAESIFFYMMVAGLLITPFALMMTDFTKPINTGITGAPLAFAIQVLNAIGALFLVYAFRYGKAMIVAPLSNAGAPLITAILSLLIMGVVPGPVKIVGLILALIASLMLALAA